MLERFVDKKVDRDWLNTNFPCMMACPAHTNAGRYVALIAEGEFEEAYGTAREPNPMASICGRVCAHPCETACRRGADRQAHRDSCAQALPYRAAWAGVAAAHRCKCRPHAAKTSLPNCCRGGGTSGPVCRARPGADGLLRHHL